MSSPVQGTSSPSPAQTQLGSLRGRRIPFTKPRAAGPADRIPGEYANTWLIGVAALGVLMLAVNPYSRPLWLGALATLVFWLGSLPMYYFLKRGRSSQLPGFELHAIFLAVCFGLAGFFSLPQEGLGQGLTDEAMGWALSVALTSVLALSAGYYGSASLWRGVKPWLNRWSRGPQTLGQFGFACVTLAVPMEFARELFVVSGLSQAVSILINLGFYVLLLLSLGGQLGRLGRFVVYFVITPWMCFYASGLRTGQLAGIVTSIVWITLIIFRVKRRLPWSLLVISGLIFIVFQPVKFHVRSLSWGAERTLSSAETIIAYWQGLGDVYGSVSDGLARKSQAVDNAFSRINHLQTLAVVVRDTPDLVPFQLGQTYVPLFTKPIPRFLWPDKPVENIGNLWAQHYGLLGADDVSTSFNLPWVVEMYFNFGWWGVVLGLAGVGAVLRFLWERHFSAPQGAIEYAFGLMILAAVCFAESNVSLQVGGVLIAWAVMVILDITFGVDSADSRKV
jgi:hypothetical protein